MKEGVIWEHISAKIFKTIVFGVEYWWKNAQFRLSAYNRKPKLCIFFINICLHTHFFWEEIFAEVVSLKDILFHIMIPFEVKFGANLGLSTL